MTSIIKDDVDDSNSDFVEEFAMVSGSHSSTLDRLHAWERKLYDEIKVHFMLCAVSSSTMICRNQTWYPSLVSVLTSRIITKPVYLTLQFLTVFLKLMISVITRLIKDVEYLAFDICHSLHFMCLIIQVVCRLCILY